ncbi:uncharacterized protein GGS22DRAFT_129082 [Annulohypoxylon maeteangense]|uniref:uncharacterized protein n=1 Tax=Annulohypoxylon maeteangense TaxID=1927788 RepID=UPI002008E7A7|nr:uncharacterized protein GGS22DRAFT_129082 [Annulohypoxylon maeteangense]KAI0885428.1 hypothetical protein GGS22DRAFT_129082 [Annulohypoxylon maeteangense]
MAEVENENLEIDLFADLYDDDGAPASIPAAAAPAAQPSNPVPAPATTSFNQQPAVESYSRPENDQDHNDVAHTIEENGYGDEYQDDNYDDDDDVDFNLGNGPTGAVTAVHNHQDDSSVFHTTRGPSAKEDG